MKTSTGSPTKAEQERLDLLRNVGCICCLMRFGSEVPEYEIHHIVQGDRRLGHWYTLPLCFNHHRGKMLSGDWTSIAQGSKAFSKVHGTELEIWGKLQRMLGLDDTLPPTKIVSRSLA